MERVCNRRKDFNVINAMDPISPETNVMEEVTNSDERDPREAYKEPVLSQSCPQNTVTDDHGGSVTGQPKRKFFGSWDPVRRGMTWQEVDDGSDIQLEKDPVTQTYQPFVRKKGNDVAGSLSPADKEELKSKTNEGHKAEKNPEQPRSTLSWKKRARKGQLEVSSPVRGNALEGKRKGGVVLDMGTEAEAKKGRKIKGGDARSSHVQAEAVEQPRLSQ